MNRKFRIVSIAAALLTALTASAQDYGRWRGRGDNYGYNRGQGYGNSDRIVGRVLSDLDRAQSRSYDHRHHKEFDHARNDLLKFQDKLSQGRFDRGKLDSAIGNVDRASRLNGLNPGDRDRLYRDLQELRDYRARGEYNRYGRR